MIILHVGILDNKAVVWAEESITTVPAPKRKGRSPRARTSAIKHPFSAHHHTIVETILKATPALQLSDRVAPVKIWLPSNDNMPAPSSRILCSNEFESVPDETLKVRDWEVYGVILRDVELIQLLKDAENEHILFPGVLLGSEFYFFSQLIRFGASIVARQQYLPSVIKENDLYFARWKPVYNTEDQSRLAKLSLMMPDVVRALSAAQVSAISAPSSKLQILKQYLNSIVDDIVRTSNPPPAQGQRTSPKHDSVHDCWLAALRSWSGIMTFDETELARFAEQVEEWQQPITAVEAAQFRLCFRLEEPAPPDEDDEIIESIGKDDWHVSYLLQDVSDQSLLIPAQEVWQKSETFKAAFSVSKFKPREHLLLSLGQASRLCGDIEDSLRKPAPDGFELDNNRAFNFLSEKAQALEQAGFGVMLPSWWTKGASRKSLKKTAVVSDTMKVAGDLTMSKIAQFDWQLALGDVQLSQAELNALAALKAPLVNIRGQWVHVTADDINAAVEFLERRSQGKMTLRELVKLSLGTESGDTAVKAGGAIGEFLDQLKNSEEVDELPAPQGFVGQLRPYQQRGFSWLSFLTRWGLGACLADDMGLGKTIQTLAMIQKYRAEGEKKPVLLVCPTSVVNNWCREVARFTPDLSVLVHHGGGRSKGEAFRAKAARNAIVISTYPLMFRDIEHLKSIEWAGVVLDEAQNIKNSETKQFQSAQELVGQYRIALTGTPVENTVGDLWSIMQFLNPNFLGNKYAFREQFLYPIHVAKDADARERLKQITQPFILRRLKTDKTIINDLPEKQEMKVYCYLTKEQATLYSAVLTDFEQRIQSTAGIARSGLVLSTLARLKQVCNHPAHFSADNSPVLAGRSGKLDRLTEMIEEVLTAGDKTLIFTQFTQMAELIKRHLEEKFGVEILYLHGGVKKSKRDEMVDRFQSPQGPSIFLLSLKAGGTGLNLVAASQVFHFDRWWNPAVENQASDRAYRIGQKRNVQIWKYICGGTLEEKIDNIIESKQTLADNVIGTGEAWLTKMSDDELRDILALNKEAIAD